MGAVSGPERPGGFTDVILRVAGGGEGVKSGPVGSGYRYWSSLLWSQRPGWREEGGRVDR